MRLDGKVALVVGAGQTPGETIGNGRATAMLFAREGARVICADRDLSSATETVEMITADGGEAAPVEADVVEEASVRAAIGSTVERWGRLDVLHNNVGVSLIGGDAVLDEITVEAFDRVTAINIRGIVLTCKHAVPVMRSQGAGAIVNIASTAAFADYPYVAYKTSKAGVIAFTQHVAIRNASYGIRANAILPGFMNTPMAIEARVAAGRQREELIAERDAAVPLGGRQGSGWDVAYAALFLASDEAKFITGVALPVDGGMTLKVG